MENQELNVEANVGETKESVRLPHEPELSPEEEARGMEYARQIKRVGRIGLIVGDALYYLLLEFFLICLGWSFRMHAVADLVISLLSMFLYFHFCSQMQVLIRNKYVRWTLMAVGLLLPVAVFALVGYLDVIPEWKVHEEIRNLF